MPETKSVERRNLMRAFGAELVSPKALGGEGAIEEAERLAGGDSESPIPRSSPTRRTGVYERTTGPG